MKRSINPVQLILTLALILIAFGIFIVLAVRKNLEETQPEGTIALYTPAPTIQPEDLGVPAMARPKETVLDTLKKAELTLEETGLNTYYIPDEYEIAEDPIVHFDITEGYVTGFTLTLPAIAEFRSTDPSSEIEEFLIQCIGEQNELRDRQIAELLPLLFDAVAGPGGLPYSIQQNWINDVLAVSDKPDISARHDGFTFLVSETIEEDLQLSLILP